MRVVLMICIMFLIGHNAMAQNKAGTVQRAQNATFPFIISLTSVEYDVTVNLNDEKVKATYAALFKRNHIDFTPEAWENIITELLDNKDAAMAQQIITSAQNGVLRIGTGGIQYQKAFVDYVVPIFSDTRKLEDFIKDDQE